MVTAAQADADLVEHLADVVGMGALDVERDDAQAALGAGGPLDPDAGQGAEAVQDRGRELDLLAAQRRPVQRGQPGGGRAQADHGPDRRRAGLEPVRRRGVGGPLDLDPADHLAAAQERRQFRQEVLAAPEGTGARRTEHLVAGEGVEIAAQRLDVDRPVRGALGAVEDQERAHRVGGVAQAPDLGHRTGDVGGMRDGDDPRPRRNHVVQAVVVESALLGDRDRADPRTHPLGRHLPGDDVAVVLELRDQDLVAGPKARGQGVGSGVQGQGAAGGEDHLVRVGGAEVGRDLGAGLLERDGGLVREAVDPALHVGPARGLEVPERVRGRPADLPGGRIVQVVERGRLRGEDRELVAQAGHATASV